MGIDRSAGMGIDRSAGVSPAWELIVAPASRRHGSCSQTSSAEYCGLFLKHPRRSTILCNESGPLAQLVEHRTFNVGVNVPRSSCHTAHFAHGYADSS